MKLKSILLASGAFGGMTANERRLGRFIRDGEGHPAPAAPAAAPEAAPAAPEAAPAPAAPEAPDDHGTRDYLDFERSLEADDDGGVDTPPAEDDAGQEEPPAPDEPGASVQDQIDAAVKAEKDRADDLARQLAEAKAPPKEPVTPPAPRSAEQAPNPDDYDFGEADTKFIADTARFHARQEFAAQTQQAELRAQVAEVENTWKGAVTQPEIVQAYPDFEDKVTRGGDRGDWDCSPVTALLIKSSPVGPHVAYHLATNVAESKRIASLNPIEQALEVGRLEGRFLNSGKATVPPKTVSSAPTPPEARSRGAGGKFTVADDTDDFAAFDKKADAILDKTKR